MIPPSPRSSPNLRDRRSFLKNSAIASGFTGLGLYLRAQDKKAQSRVIAPYGPLIPDKDKLLDLPEGFTYQMISKKGTIMSDGFKVPGKFDDMAAFEGVDGRVVLIRNHELQLSEQNIGPFATNRYPKKLDRDLSYDPGGIEEEPQVGGTTTLVYNPETGKLEKEFLSLVGSDRNCSGGTVPFGKWGSWITCEEPDDMFDTDRGRRHGYCFEVKADPELGLQKATPLKALGRFRHEAIAYDEIDGSIYLTEDRDDSLLYRFVPSKKNDLSSGKLYALALKDQPHADLRNNQKGKRAVMKEGEVRSIRWIEMDGIDSPKDDLRSRGYAKGAASFARGEGIFYSEGAFYVCCTNGGPEQRGQVFRILPHHYKYAEPVLELFLEPGESDLLTNGDNLCAAPNGDLYICEDLIGPHDQVVVPHLRGVTPEGKIFNFARNAQEHKNDEGMIEPLRHEFCGSCFSPDGKILFVNLQKTDKTFAIKGPWRA